MNTDDRWPFPTPEVRIQHSTRPRVERRERRPHEIQRAEVSRRQLIRAQRLAALQRWLETHP